MKKTLQLFIPISAAILILCATSAFAQRHVPQATVDSLFAVLKTEKDDTPKVNTLYEIMHAYRYDKSDTAVYYSTLTLAPAQKLNYKNNDSIYNEDTKKIIQYQLQNEFDKKESLAKAEQEKKDAIALKEVQKQKIIRISFIVAFITAFVFAIVFFVQRNKISKERKRSDALLLNILPYETANELKAKGSANAKLFDDVTVMFTDFKDFTQISEKLTPADLVAEIDYCFKAFDNIMTKYNIEKIKTIGDSYMAVGGLPVENKTNAEDTIMAALDIQKFMQQYKQEKLKENQEYFEIRIGVHTGPVVAGIVGIKKYSYDIWGDTVNIASRMESTCEAGKVNISQSTYLLVKNKFPCTHRGKVEAKNKGEIDMYFVETN